MELSNGVLLTAAAQDVALTAMNLTLVIVVVALVWVCVVAAPTPRTSLIGVAASVVTIGTLVTIVGTSIGASASAGTLAVVFEILGGLLDIVVKLVATGTLWLLLRGVRAGRMAPAPQQLPALEDEAQQGETDSEAAQPAVAVGWSADPTQGAAWASAEDAAHGAAGTTNAATPTRAGTRSSGETLRWCRRRRGATDKRDRRV